MTQAPRSGAGRSNPRGGGASGGSRGFGKGSKPSTGRTGGPKSGSDRGAQSGGFSSGAPKSGGFKSGAPKSGGFKSGAPKSGGFKSGNSRPSRDDAPAAEGYRSGAPKSGGFKPGGAKKGGGERPFRNERFGRNLGPVTKRPHTRRPGKPVVSEHHDPEGIRLQKVMASAGVASRRVCEEMIQEGRVEVDGEVVTELGVRVDPKTVSIHVDGMSLQLDETQKYYVFNKPRGVISTMEDPEGRPCISDYLKNTNKHERLFHVGRLDNNTEGLLLLTNDGELANRLTHPSYEVPKTYLVQVRGPMAHGVGAQMREGLELEDGFAKVDSFRLVDSTPGHILVEVVLHSGRNRIVRRLFDAVGHPVERLVRTQMGPIRLNDQRQGSIRVLGRHEVGHLLASVGL
ncbi:rRNA pseudouridine synthase [Arthrobacter sp. Sa2CUA1]|uniref:Pseudouridine synthase n=1 Tax=Arthrobacter gallicola TaxID=2762225 RepID=A0ABR8UMD3_9MICC|nr:pseudouridine synthase [Arthrobacter gallicola]MBD7993715.1 rRNA pseudouridine synthase [Arthrobacter gallicola]